MKKKKTPAPLPKPLVLEKHKYYITKDMSLVYIQQEFHDHVRGKVIEAHPKKVAMVYIPRTWRKDGVCMKNRNYQIIGEY